MNQDAIVELFYNMKGDLDKINQYIDSKLQTHRTRKISTLEMYIQSRLSANPKVLKLANMEINPLEASYLSMYPELENLETLDLRQNRLGDEGLAAIAQSTVLKNLKTLDVRNNQITRQGVAILSQSATLTMLENVDLRSNKLGRRWEEKLKEVGNFPNLKVVKTL